MIYVPLHADNSGRGTTIDLASGEVTFILFVCFFLQIAVGILINPDQVNRTWHAFWAASDFLVIKAGKINHAKVQGKLDVICRMKKKNK